MSDNVKPVDLKIVEAWPSPALPGCEIDTVWLIEKGTESKLPVMIFEGDIDGKRVRFALTGRYVNVLSAAIKGVNMRNHGIEEL